MFRRLELDRANFQLYHILYFHQLSLQERLAVFHADHFAVVAGELVHLVLEAIDGEEDSEFFVGAGGLAFLGPELGSEGEDGFVALGVFGGDIHDEGRTDVGEGSGIENLEGAVRLAFERELLEAGEEAAFVAEGRSVIVVGVARFPVGDDDGFWAQLAKDSGETEFVLAGGLDIGVGNAEVAAPLHTEDLGGFGSFFGARFGSAAGAHFAGGEIEDAGLVAALGHFEERAAASEFDVIGVSGDGEQIELHEASGSL